MLVYYHVFTESGPLPSHVTYDTEDTYLRWIVSKDVALISQTLYSKIGKYSRLEIYSLVSKTSSEVPMEDSLKVVTITLEVKSSDTIQQHLVFTGKEPEDAHCPTTTFRKS